MVGSVFAASVLRRAAMTMWNVADSIDGNGTVDGGAHVNGDLCAGNPGDTSKSCNP